MPSSPSELAALVAREADVGVAGALGALDAAGVLVLESIVARVADVPRDADGRLRAESLDEVVWQAEVVMRATPSDPGARNEPVLSDLVADLPVAALKGVGPAWRARLTRYGVGSVGALAIAKPTLVASLVTAYGAGAAELAGRARGAVTGVLPTEVDGPAWSRLSVLDVATADPDSLPGEPAVALAAWNACLRLAAALDADVLARLKLGDVASR